MRLVYPDNIWLGANDYRVSVSISYERRLMKVFLAEWEKYVKWPENQQNRLVMLDLLSELMLDCVRFTLNSSDQSSNN